MKEFLWGLQKSLRLFVRKSGVTVIVLLAIAMLFLPYLLKDTELPLGKESYYNLKLAEGILDGDLPDYFNFGWPVLMALTSFVFNLEVEIAMNILLFLLGVVSIVLFYNILNKFGFEVKFISSLVLIISPIFIYLFTIGGNYTVPVVLALLSTYFTLDKKYLIAGISFIFIPFFDLESSFLIGIVFLFYFIYLKKKKLAFLLIFLLLILSFVYFENYNFNFISDFGSEIGLSIFSVFLFFIGFGLFWRKKQYFLLYLICTILFLFYLKFDWVLIYFNLFLSILIAISFIELYERRWESDVIKKLTLLLLVCGLLFSGLSYAKEASENLPNEEFFKALNEIPDGSRVFSSIYNKHWVNYGNKNFIEFSENDYKEILVLRDAEISRFLLDKYGVKYILIDNKMEKGIWKGKREGLLWVVNYDEHFINIYDGKYIDIWGFK